MRDVLPEANIPMIR
jgi:hypothetical protein